MINCHNIGVFWGPYTPSTAPKIIPACLGGCRPSIWHVSMEHKASCGVLGVHFRWRRPWLAMVVLVNVGRWRLTSDRPTVGIVKIVYGSIFFYSYADPIHSWHLTRQLNTEDLDLRTFAFSWFLCPVFNGSHHLPAVQIYWYLAGGKSSTTKISTWRKPLKTYREILSSQCLLICLPSITS